MRACLFAAVSTEEQSDPLLPSLDSQLAACERFVSGQEGWQVVERIRVEGHSRYYSRLDRLCQDSERYRRLVALIEDKACDVVVCYSYDRLWRKAALQGQLCALADDAGVWLYSISQPTQRGQEQVNLWLHAVYGVSAQQEIINLRDRRNRGMAGRIQRRGLHGSTWAPYGYRWQSALGEQGDLSSPGALLVIYRPEAHWVSWIYEQRAEAWSCWRIAQSLNEQHAPTKRGGVWDLVTVRRIVNNPVYAGMAHYKGISAPGKHEAIISPALWDTVQRINEQFKQSRAVGRGHHLFAGLARCAECGSAMATDSSRGQAYLRCGAYLRDHWDGTRKQGCHCNYVNFRRTRAYVLARVRQYVAEPAAFLEAQRAAAQVDRREQRMEALRTELADIDQQQKRLVRAIAAGALPVEACKEMQSELDKRKAACADELLRLNEAEVHLQALGQKMESMQEALDRLDQMSDEELKPYLVQLIKTVWVRPKAEPVIEWYV